MMKNRDTGIKFPLNLTLPRPKEVCPGRERAHRGCFNTGTGTAPTAWLLNVHFVAIKSVSKKESIHFFADPD